LSSTGSARRCREGLKPEARVRIVVNQMHRIEGEVWSATRRVIVGANLCVRSWLHPSRTMPGSALHWASQKL